MNLWDMFKASKGIPVSDPMAMLWGYQYRKKHSLSEISGVPPLHFTSRGGSLIDYRICGNTVQNGTPSPQAPVYVVGCGVRTGNLFDKSTMTTGYFAYVHGITPNSSYYCSDFIPITAATYYFQNVVGSTYQNSVAVYDANKQGLRYEKLLGSDKASGAMTFKSGDAYIRINCYFRTDVNTVMVNIGNAALPYEPYGYKIPVTVSDGTNSITTPVYLGSEPLHKIGDYADYVDFKRGVVMRGIKKLVLTGTEPDLMLEASSYFYLNNPIENAKKRRRVYSSHFMGGDNLYNNTVIISNTGRLNFTTTDIPHSVAEFASFLAQQYEAGTPVTVWYVLAEPEEEPLENLLPIQTIRGSDVLTVGTTVRPSNIWIKGKIKAID